MTFVDDFDDDLSAWTNPSGNFSIATSDPFAGSGNLQGTGETSPVDLWSSDGDGLAIYPTKGHEWTLYVRSDTVDEPSAVRQRIWFGLEDASVDPDDNGYMVQLNWYQTDNWFLFESDDVNGLTELDSDGAITGDLAADTWYRLEFTWDDGTLGGSDGDITVELYDATGDTPKSTLSANNLEHAGSDIAVSLEDDDTQAHVMEVDQWEVTNVESAVGPSVTAIPTLKDFALRYDGDGADIVDVDPVAGWDDDTQLTVAFTVHTPDTTFTNWQDLMESGWTDPGSFNYNMRAKDVSGNGATSDTGSVQFGIVDSAGTLHEVAGGTLDPDTTYTFAGTYDGSTMRVYVNAEEVASLALDGELLDTTDFVRTQGNHEPYTLDLTVMDDRAWSVEELETFDRDHVPPDDVVIEWPFDERALGTAQDVSGNGNDARVQNAIRDDALFTSSETATASESASVSAAATPAASEKFVSPAIISSSATPDATETVTASESPDFRHSMDASATETVTASESASVSATGEPFSALESFEFPEVDVFAEPAAAEATVASESLTTAATAALRLRESVPSFVSTARLGDIRLGHARLGTGEPFVDETASVAVAAQVRTVRERSSPDEPAAVDSTATPAATETVTAPEASSFTTFGTPDATGVAAATESAAAAGAATPTATHTASAVEAASAAAAAATLDAVERTVFPESGTAAAAATLTAAEQAVSVDEAAATLGTGTLSVTSMAHVDERAVADATGSLPAVPETVVTSAKESASVSATATGSAVESTAASESAASAAVGEPAMAETAPEQAETGAAAATGTVSSRERVEIDEAPAASATATLSAVDTTPTVTEDPDAVRATGTPGAVEFAPPVSEAGSAAAAGAPTASPTAAAVEAASSDVTGSPAADALARAVEAPSVAAVGSLTLVQLVGQSESAAAAAAATLASTDVASAVESPTASGAATLTQTESTTFGGTPTVAAAATPSAAAETVVGSTFTHHDAYLDGDFDPRRDRDGVHSAEE